MAMSRPVKPEDLALALECPVCHDHYCSPKILPCGHTLCLSPCLEQITDGKPQLRCPECRTEHDVPEGGVEHFPTNVTVARMFATPKKSEHVFGCPICGEMEERTKCLHCGLMLCEECRQSHSIKFRDQLMELLSSLKDDKAPAAIDSLAEQKTKADVSVKKVVDLAIRKIKDAAEQARDIINKKTEELIGNLEDFGRVEMENISMWCDENTSEMKEVIKCCDRELQDLKPKIPSQTKMAKLMSSLNEKQHTVRQTSHSFQRVMRDINVTTDLQPLEEVVRSLAQVVVSQMYDTAEHQELCEETNKNVGSVLVREISTNKLCIGSEGNGDSYLKNPYGVAVDPITSDIIVADHGNNRIQVFDKDGQPKCRFGSQGIGQDHFHNPIGVALSSEGYIIVTDYNNHRVKIHTRAGGFVRMFGRNGSGNAEFKWPYGAAVDGNGHMHICDSINKRVQVFANSGEYQYQYNTWKSVCDVSPYGISINRNGNISVTLNNNIAVMNKQLQLLSVFKQGSVDVCWIDDDHLLVPDHKNHVLKVYTVSGELVKQFGDPGYCVGQLQYPRGVAVDEDGFVYVVSRDNHMVQKF